MMRFVMQLHRDGGKNYFEKERDTKYETWACVVLMMRVWTATEGYVCMRRDLVKCNVDK